MKLSLKNLLIILGALVLGYFAVQFTKSDGRSKSLRSELVSIDTAEASRVEISGSKGMVTLTKDGSNWMVALDKGEKETKPNTVKSMLEVLNTIRPDRLASRKKDKWKDYEVDSTGTRVKVYTGDNVTTDIVLGRFGVEGQRNFYSFVRLFEDENVYVANGFMKMSIYEDPNDYRNNTVIRLKKDSLTQITFSYPDGDFALTKNENWFFGNAQADSASIAGFFQGLNYATSKDFYNSAEPANYSHRVTFSFSDAPDITLEGTWEDASVIIKSSENSTEIFSDNALWDKVFKDPGVFATTLE